MVKYKKEQKWMYEECVLCYSKDDRGLGLTYRYVDGEKHIDKKYHQFCMVRKLLELEEKINNLL